MKAFWVYILLCADGTFYVGVTSDILRRLREHLGGYSKKAYTYSRRPLRLVWSQQFDHPLDAIAAEKKLKGWSHDKKKALINGDLSLLTQLSECRNASHYLNEDIRRHGATTPLFDER